MSESEAIIKVARKKMDSFIADFLKDQQTNVTPEEEAAGMDAYALGLQIGANRLQAYPDKWAAVLKWSLWSAVALLRKDGQIDEANAIIRDLCEQCLERGRKDPVLAEFLTGEIAELMLERIRLLLGGGSS